MELILKGVEETPTIPEDAILSAIVGRVEQVTKPWTDDNDKPVEKMSFEFKIIDKEFSGQRAWGETPLTFNNGAFCKLYGWICQILGVDKLEKDFRLDTDILSGLECRIVIGYTKPKDPAKQPRMYVSDVLAKASSPAILDQEDPF